MAQSWELLKYYENYWKGNDWQDPNSKQTEAYVDEAGASGQFDRGSDLPRQPTTAYVTSSCTSSSAASKNTINNRNALQLYKRNSLCWN